MNFRFLFLVVLVVANVVRASFPVESSASESLLVAAKNGKLEIVKELVERGANINDAAVKTGKTALMFAAWAGHVVIAQWVIANGADVNQVDNSGDSAIMYAAKRGHINIVQLLIETGANINHVSSYGNFPLLCAATHGQVAIANLLIENGAHVDFAHVSNTDYPERTALIEAAVRGDFAIVELLIENGANVNYVDNFQNTALDFACLADDFRTAQLLIENGADVNHVGRHGITALRDCAIHGHLSIARMLIESGANVNHVDNFGKTALMYSVSGGDSEIAKLLIENGADVNHTDASGGSALSLAGQYDDIGHPSICKLLILAGANTDADNILNRETCVEPSTAPLEVIRNSVVSREAFTAVLPTLQEIGIHTIQGFVSYAFESLRNQVDVFGDPEIISFLEDHDWDSTKIETIKSIIHKLVQLKCTDLNVLYVVGPFIRTADDRTLRRLVVSLEFLTNAIPVLAVSDGNSGDIIVSNGRVLNAMIHRSAQLGFQPVLKAFYTFYFRTLQGKRVRNRLRVPDEVLTLIDTFWEGSLGAYSNLEINAMAELETAIQRQRRVLESINETEQITVASYSSTGSYGRK